MPNPFLDVDYYSVHEDFIGNAAVPLPHEAHPISMSEPDVMGLALANEACAQLAAGAKVEQSLFAAIIRRQDIVQPIAGRFRSKLRSDGWRIAAYKRINPAEGGEWNAHSPVSLKIAAVNVYVRDVDIEEFMARLKSYQFIVDLFPGDRVAAKLPPYVSGKLSEMINANRLFWNDADMIDAPERERRRVEVLKYLKSAFSQLCDKQSKPKSLAKFAANFCDSALMPKSQKLLSTSVTPAMLALLTAAKLYWSAHCKHSPTHETYPSREAIVEFLRFMGLREANAASAGATLIRPEALRAPEPQPDWLTTLLRRRQGLRH